MTQKNHCVNTCEFCKKIYAFSGWNRIIKNNIFELKHKKRIGLLKFMLKESNICEKAFIISKSFFNERALFCEVLFNLIKYLTTLGEMSMSAITIAVKINNVKLLKLVMDKCDEKYIYINDKILKETKGNPYFLQYISEKGIEIDNVHVKMMKNLYEKTIMENDELTLINKYVKFYYDRGFPLSLKTITKIVLDDALNVDMLIYANVDLDSYMPDLLDKVFEKSNFDSAVLLLRKLPYNVKCSRLYLDYYFYIKHLYFRIKHDMKYYINNDDYDLMESRFIKYIISLLGIYDISRFEIYSRAKKVKLLKMVLKTYDNYFNTQLSTVKSTLTQIKKKLNIYNYHKYMIRKALNHMLPYDICHIITSFY